MIKNIPCIKNKCILLPVCKSKAILTCDELQFYYENLIIILTCYGRNESNQYVYMVLNNYIHEILPNIRWLYHTDRNNNKAYYMSHDTLNRHIKDFSHLGNDKYILDEEIKWALK